MKISVIEDGAKEGQGELKNQGRLETSEVIGEKKKRSRKVRFDEEGDREELKW